MTLDGTNTWLLRAPDSSAHRRRRSRPGRRPAPRRGARRGAGDRARPAHPRAPRPQRDRGGRARAHRRAGARDRPGAVPRRRGARPTASSSSAAGLDVRVLATPGAHLRLGVVRGRRRGGADRRHDPRPRHDRGRASGRQPRRVPRLAAAAARPRRRRGADRARPGAAARRRGGPDVPGAPRAAAATRSATRCANSAPDATARQIVELVYADVDQAVWWAAELSVEAQLEYLRGPTARGGPAARDRG